MRKRYLILILFLICASFCLSACNSWRYYSLDFQPGVFHVSGFEDHFFFTAESAIVLSQTEPPAETDAFVACVEGDVYFTFYGVANEVEKVDYGYIAERSITFYVETHSGSMKNFTLYAYDWTDKIYCMGYDIYFEVE